MTPACQRISPPNRTSDELLTASHFMEFSGVTALNSRMVTVESCALLKRFWSAAVPQYILPLAFMCASRPVPVGGAGPVGVDVVVTEGFTGNIALKTAEGTARFVTDLLRRAFTSSLRSKAGFALSRPALHMLKVHLDPNNHNGAVFLGLNGLVVKSHGGANAKGIHNAIRVASTLMREGITERIADDLEGFRHHAFAKNGNGAGQGRSQGAGA